MNLNINNTSPILRPAITYTTGLPILDKKLALLSAIKNNQVIVVSGETGSGKTTQLPLICLEAGRGRTGKIGCTQPRRIAAVSIANRVAQQLSCEVGEEVGYKIRFGDRDKQHTCIKFMTDGILLAEMEQQRSLTMYDTLIIDEAHERSLNIDFILGYLRTLLPKRPDLKVIISSATIDTSLFSKAFNNAPIIEVSGRMYPVELLYLSDTTDDYSISYVEEAVRAAEDLLELYSDGDMLIFMPTERDIRETCNKLRGKKRPNIRILPLFSRLSRNEQESIFNEIPERKIVVATNIAETSITVPGIQFVVDTGLARISRYAPRLRTNRLPIEPISQAAANQRMGRCGRVRDGVCIRLFPEKEFSTREIFTQPEIKRANLAGVILSMMAHKLGTIEQFPFLEPPAPSAISEGYSQLYELGAIDRTKRLTRLGRTMAHLPLDPHIARMVLAAHNEHALREVTIISAALSIVDPRERPFEKQNEADEMHKRFTVPGSDFLSLLKLWEEYSSEWKSLKTQNRMRRFCKDHFLSFPRMQEWFDVHHQIRKSVLRMKKSKGNSTNASPDAIHRSLLTGLVSNCACKQIKGNYRAAHGRELLLFPGSVVYGDKPEWIMCHEVIETSQIFAHTIAPINPSWLEELAAHLCTRTYSEPWFDATSGIVKCIERVHLFGLPIAEHHGISFSRINPQQATEVFIRSGLVEEQLQQALPFYLHNKKIRNDIELLEAKIRSRSLFAGEEVIVSFYSERLHDVGSIHDLNRFIKKQGNDQFLRMKQEDLCTGIVPESVNEFPDVVTIAGKSFPVTYCFEPGNMRDGVTLHVKHNEASFVTGASLNYCVPALWSQKIEQMLRLLPKEYRKQLIPINQKAAEIAKTMRPSTESFEVNCAQCIRSLYDIAIDPSLLEPSRIPEHCSLRVELCDESGTLIASGRSIDVLKKLLSDTPIRNSDWKHAFSSYQKQHLSSWSIDDLPEYITITSHGTDIPLYGYPALVDKTDHVDLEFFPSPEIAGKEHIKGVKKLLEIVCSTDFAWVERDLRFSPQLKLLCAPYGGAEAMKKMILSSLRTHLLSIADSNPKTKNSFAALASECARQSKGIADTAMDALEQSLRYSTEIISLLKNKSTTQPVSIKKELLSDAYHYFEEFKNPIPFKRLMQFPRYLKAFIIRINRAHCDPGKYTRNRTLLETVKNRSKNWTDQVAYEIWQLIDEYQLMVEEYAISLFAQQEIKARFPISEKRLEKKAVQIEALLDPTRNLI